MIIVGGFDGHVRVYEFVTLSPAKCRKKADELTAKPASSFDVAALQPWNVYTPPLQRRRHKAPLRTDSAISISSPPSSPHLLPSRPASPMLSPSSMAFMAKGVAKWKARAKSKSRDKTNQTSYIKLINSFRAQLSDIFCMLSLDKHADHHPMVVTGGVDAVIKVRIIFQDDQHVNYFVTKMG